MKEYRMRLFRRTLITGAICASLPCPSVWAQSKTTRTIVLGQSVPLTGAAEQIGFAYYTGAKLHFDALNAKNGVAGNKIEVKFVDDGYKPEVAAANAKRLIDSGVDALFGFVGTS